MTRLTLAEVAQTLNGSNSLDAVQNLTAYLFKGAPVDLKSVSWDYFVKQFMSRYYNREISTFQIEHFRTLLVGEMMKYRAFMSVMEMDLLQKVADGGFNLTETVTREGNEDKTKSGTHSGSASDVGKTKQVVGGTTNQTVDQTVTDNATGTVDSSSEGSTKTLADGTTGDTSTTSGTSSASSTGQIKNTGTQDTDITGTEDRTGSHTGSVESATGTTSSGTDTGSTTVEGDTSNRDLFSKNPQSIVNASSTGNPDDINWKYATELRDNIGKSKTTTTADDANTAKSDSTTESSTVDNTKDLLTLDRNQKMTDNRTQDTTTSDTGETSSTTTGSGTSTMDTETTSSTLDNTSTSADSNSVTTGETTTTETNNTDVDTTLTKTQEGQNSETENVGRMETMSRVLAKLTPLEGNMKLYEFVNANLEEPVMRIVNEMDKLFISMYPDEERWIPFGWMEREACVAKL